MAGNHQTVGSQPNQTPERGSAKAASRVDCLLGSKEQLCYTLTSDRFEQHSRRQLVIRQEHQLMKQIKKWLTNLIVMANGLAMVSSALADTTISTFENFNLDGLFGNWASATVVSGPTAYSITSSGFGSG